MVGWLWGVYPTGSLGVLHGVKLKSPTVVAGLTTNALLAMSLPRLTSSVFWNHLLNKILSLESLSQNLLLMEPDNNMIHQVHGGFICLVPGWFATYKTYWSLVIISTHLFQSEANKLVFWKVLNMLWSCENMLLKHLFGLFTSVQSSVSSARNMLAPINWIPRGPLKISTLQLLSLVLLGHICLSATSLINWNKHSATLPKLLWGWFLNIIVRHLAHREVLCKC